MKITGTFEVEANLRDLRQVVRMLESVPSRRR